MGFTIPNASATSIIDQAEPDSVDFTALGQRDTGVVSGCLVTATATPDQNVSVAVGEVVTGGTFKTVSATTLAMGASDSTSPRFDLVVVTSSGTVAKRQGTAGNNPSFPSLTSGDVLLAAVYRRNPSQTTIVATDIIDKRVMTPSSIVRSGVGDPVTALGGTSAGNVGDVYINTALSSTSGQSQVWIKTTPTLWENLGEYTVPQASVNTSNTLVLRDASGNFSAGTITANLSGNATTVTNGVYNNGSTYGISISQNAATATTATYATSAGAAASATFATSATNSVNADQLSGSRTFSLTGSQIQGSVSSNLASGFSISPVIQPNAVTKSMLNDGANGDIPKITVSLNAASGPGKDGDLWIQVV